MSSVLSGILPVLPTPFRVNGENDLEAEIDLEAMRRIVQFACEAGVQGLVFPGFASEVESLSQAERATLLEIVVHEAAGRVPVIAGASAASPKEVAEHGRVAGALGVKHLMVQPPKSAGVDAGAVAAFLAEVAGALPNMEIILQNAPAPRGSDLAPEAMVDIVSAVPQITYVKEETLPAGPAISHILANSPATLKGVIGGGGARYILDEYARGACAAMPALELADEHVSLDAAWRRGDLETARAIYVRTLPLLTLQAVYRMRLTKHVLMRRGVLTDVHVRAPTPVIDGYALEDIDANLRKLGVRSGVKREVA
ncbi:dihydrodipicolinate synthase family protein [Nitratireductor soli]|uniref:dihydrodipicolinate synthase family protein n=1 Tax=Nitratireductor soli TaxID=1670619 RepID=UPI00065DE91A|nr:dihydrodipicolinate synthase family protein [Nitratireductor soli]